MAKDTIKVKDVASIIYSDHGNLQFAIVYDRSANMDIENGCSVEYAINKYGDRELKRIMADEDKIVFVI